MAVQYVGAIIGRPNKCGGIPKYERDVYKRQVYKQRQGRIFCGSVQMISRDVYVLLAMIICGGALAVVFDMLRACLLYTSSCV